MTVVGVLVSCLVSCMVSCSVCQFDTGVPVTGLLNFCSAWYESDCMPSVAFSWSGDTIPTLTKRYLPTSRLHAPTSADLSRRARWRVYNNASQAGLLQFVRRDLDAHGNYRSCFLNVPTLHPGGFLDNFMPALFHPGPASKCTVVSCRFHTSSLHLVVWVGWRCHWRAASVSRNPFVA